MRKLVKFFLICLVAFLANAKAENPNSNIEKFDDWILSCSPNKELCIANQTIRTEKGAPIALMNISYVKEIIVLEIGLPLMMNLQKPIKVKVDDNLIGSYAYNTCSQIACFVIRNNDDDLLKSFKSGNKATVTAEGIDRRKLDLIFSLKGFTDTLNKLKGK